MYLLLTYDSFLIPKNINEKLKLKGWIRLGYNQQYIFIASCRFMYWTLNITFSSSKRVVGIWNNDASKRTQP